MNTFHFVIFIIINLNDFYDSCFFLLLLTFLYSFFFFFRVRRDGLHHGSRFSLVSGWRTRPEYILLDLVLKQHLIQIDVFSIF